MRSHRLDHRNRCCRSDELDSLLPRDRLQAVEQARSGGIQCAPARQEYAELADHLRLDDRPHVQSERIREPAHVARVAEAIAELRGTTAEAIAASTHENHVRLFNP